MIGPRSFGIMRPEVDGPHLGARSVGREIERKFLVVNEGWRPARTSKEIRQGYLAFGPPASVRVRIADGRADLNIKRSTLAISREEFEFEIPRDDGEAMLRDLCTGEIVEKTRYLVDYRGLTWEVDVFGGANEGLVIAEVELDQDDQMVEAPPWVGAEVSGDPRYLNSNLAQHPYREWDAARP